ncbi:unnamed protein product [Calicophoron daubneyi]|uniref:UNC-45/Cro1/She4 central domain-containing protein n=1 Tax=Calicophoron daubneyi TaxID=300641 RepID=A0AAV2TQN8_CALDB
MEELISLKDKGNELFKNGSYREAIALYNQCLLEAGLSDSLQCILHSNKAQAYLKLEEYDSAVKSADAALKILPSDSKALFRRCQAYEKLGVWENALQDSRRLIQLEPKNEAAKRLARRIEMTVSSRIAEAESVPTKMNGMFDILINKESSTEKLEQALNNLTALISENGPSAASLIWNHPCFSEVFKLAREDNEKMVVASHRLLAHTFEYYPDRCLLVLERLTPQYFVDRIFSRKPEKSLEICRFLNALLEGFTQLKAYEKAKEADSLNTNKMSAKVAPVKYPKYKIDPSVEKPVFGVLQHLLKATNSYRLSAATRDYILEMLIRFVPSDKGIGWSRKLVKSEGVLERLLEVGGAAGTSSLKDWRSRRSRQLEAQKQSTGEVNTLETTFRLLTGPNTRMTLACLLAKVYDDLVSDKDRNEFNDMCTEFVLDLFSDRYLETKIEAASVIGTLFLGPYEVGASILARSGVLEGLFILTQSINQLHQTIALDTIILATQKREQCANLVSKAVPVLQTLYKSENDGTKIRALVALCKFGSVGGTDTSIKSLTQGSTLSLMKACRRLLLGMDQPEPDVGEITAAPQPEAKVTDQGLMTIDEVDESDTDDEFVTRAPSKRRVRPANMKSDTINAHFPTLKDSDTVRWAIEGLAYLSLDAEVKQEIVGDPEFVRVLFHVAAVDFKECAFPLASLVANLTNSLPRNEVLPEMVELAKFAKQHIPQDHPLDAKEVANERRRRLVNAGLPTVLYNITIRLARGPVGSELGLRELISRVYLSTAEEVENRGKLAQAGAGKALLDLALKSNTDSGKVVASQALARLAITADPRVTFPGQRSLELVRPLLQLLSGDCDGLPNYEGLLALTNLASLDDSHRHRIMAERGLPLIDQHMFEENPMLRRAAVECIANMANYHPFVVACGGTLPLDEVHLGSKLPFLKSSTERVKLLVLYCCEFEDLQLVRAASGALATMSHDPGIITLITKTSSWFETLQTLAGHEACALQHRGAHILRNIVIHGERSLAEYLCRSNMLEVIMSLSQMPDIAPSDHIAADIALSPGLSVLQVRQQAEKDRSATRECATDALKKLQEYGLVEHLPPRNGRSG